MDYIELLENALKVGDTINAQKAIDDALEKGVDAIEIMDNGLIPGIRLVGDLFEEGKLFLPHLMRSAEVMKKGMAVIMPLITEKQEIKKRTATIILGTVEGDIHDIGKNIVSLMLSANGFDVIDLGASVAVSKFISMAKKQLLANNVVIGLTSLLTTTMGQQKVLIDTLINEGLRSKVKVMVGGACVAEEWAKDIGADGYGLNAQEAVRLAQSYIN